METLLIKRLNKEHGECHTTRGVCLKMIVTEEEVNSRLTWVLL